MADIELVIKIPENMWQQIKEGYVPLGISKYLKNGTPLLKGHGRLIDADDTISKICGSSCGCHLEECGHDKPCYSVTRIESAPTIIEADKENK